MRADDGGKLVLRLTIGILLLLHGIAKLVGGIDFLFGMVTAVGLPASFAYLVFVGEVLAPLGLIFGVFTRLSALVVVISMLFAIGLAHMPELLKLSETGGWAIELQALFLFGALAIMLLGAGRISLQSPTGRWN